MTTTPAQRVAAALTERDEQVSAQLRDIDGKLAALIRDRIARDEQVDAHFQMVDGKLDELATDMRGLTFDRRTDAARLARMETILDALAARFDVPVPPEVPR